LGAARKVDESKAAKIDPTNANILYSVLAVSWAATDDQLNDANVAGFLYVTAVDEGKKQITALSMCPGKLPSQYLLKGSLKWIEK
jgi:polyribonucleotide 5'-hydroxyl-kinase